MDAGVLQLHVFPHQAARQLQPLLAGQQLTPTLVAGGAVERTREVSLIIPTFFNDGLKCRSLLHLLAGIDNCQSVREIILVVAGTTGQQLDVLRPLVGDKPLRLAECEANQRARTRNIGAAAARCEHLLFLDDDMLLKGWSSIDVMLSYMLTEQYECALFPRRQYLKFPLLFDSQRQGQSIAAWRAGRELESSIVYDPLRHGCAFKMVSFCFPGCFTLVERQAFQRIGGFPEDYQGWGFEDTVFAMRATSQLRVLNLFRRSEPLLHIDHPVSPYKSEEYGENGRKFFSSYSTLDVEWLCDRVLSGDDFARGAERRHDMSHYLRPLREVAATCRLPLPMEKAEANMSDLVLRRLTAGQSATPDFITLHGSRGSGRSHPASDYDVLVLFRGGTVREFFVGQHKDQPRVEIEYSDQAKFEEIASRPAFHPVYGPMELAKLAQGMLLWGDKEAYSEWVRQVVEVALTCGRKLWLLVALGLQLSAEKSAAVRTQFCDALQTVMRAVDDPAGECSDEPDRPLHSWEPQHLGVHVRQLLDAHLPEWRDELDRGRRLFAFQVPEIWTALQWIAQLP